MQLPKFLQAELDNYPKRAWLKKYEIMKGVGRPSPDEYEARLEELEDQHGVNGEALAPSENPPDASDGNALAENLDTAELAELTRQNAELSKDLDAKDATIEELGQDLKTKDQTIGELERQNEQFDNDPKAKDHRLEALEQEREKLTNDLAAKERTIAALSTEGSTRLTT